MQIISIKLLIQQLYFTVRIKFELADDIQILIEDDQGAEIDADVFPILWEEEKPNITFRIQGEDFTVSAIQDAGSSPQIYYCKYYIDK